MTMPTQSLIELPLLLELDAAGGRARPKDLYLKVAGHFPDMAAEELEETLPENPTTKRWNNRVQWARQRLVGNGEAHGPERGVWALTDKGRARIGSERAQPAGVSGDVLEGKTLDELVEEHEEALKERLLTRVRELDPYAFERFAKRLLKTLGFSEMHVTAKGRDGGIDGHGQYKQGIVAVKAAYQCKRWQNPVSRPEIDKFRGAVAGSYDLGVFITTSSFSKEAQEASVKPGTVTIFLVDGRTIGVLMLRYEIGLRQRLMQVGTVDEAFFDGLSERDDEE